MKVKLKIIRESGFTYQPQVSVEYKQHLIKFYCATEQDAVSLYEILNRQTVTMTMTPK